MWGQYDSPELHYISHMYHSFHFSLSFLCVPLSTGVDSADHSHPPWPSQTSEQLSQGAVIFIHCMYWYVIEREFASLLTQICYNS